MVRLRPLLLICIGLFLCASAYADSWAGVMLGTNENPANGSTATGFTLATIVGDSLTVHVDWDGLTGGDPAAAHIHCCTTPGTNVTVAVGFPSFPATLSGTYDHVFDLTDPNIYTMNFLNNFGGGTAAGAQAALIAGLNAGMAYSNIHNAQFMGGEIRADLASIPEPATALLLAVGTLGLTGYARRRNKQTA